ncbi:MAG: YidC/Oxa1 family rane protein insertase [Pseudonocardiales bacterium]|nr:YidC/Oxa1 family rane protein insertase [Pseudonocardiales bacterium]
MLNFIYYPVSFILWVWHQAFGFVFGDDSGISWALAVVFLVFTLRALLYKPFVGQVRSMRKMQEFQPELQKVRKKYANDKQKQAAEMQRLQKEHGVNPVAGCLPVLVQVPVFIGLFHVLRTFGPVNAQGVPTNNDGSIRTQNYFFDQHGVLSFNRANLFGAKLGEWVTKGEAALNAAGTSITHMLIVMIPLMIAAGIFTHITARHSVARQTAAQGENPQTAIMNKLMLYVFPIGVVVGAPFLPLAVLLYWVSNNLWTLGQQYVVYKKIDQEQAEKREAAVVNRQSLAPKPGQKPVRPEADAPDATAKRPGAKPVTPKTAGKSGGQPATNGTNGSTSNGSGNGSGNGSVTEGSAAGSASTGTGAAGTAKNTTGTAGAGARSGGSTRPPARRPRKRR